MPKTKEGNVCGTCTHSKRSHKQNGGVEYCETCYKNLDNTNQWEKTYHQFKGEK